MVLNENVQVTYYRMQRFHSTFSDFFTSVDALKGSLSPKFNMEQVFQAGEGAGRSGSFFFFSHDNKFIVKTMSKEELVLFLRLLP